MITKEQVLEWAIKANLEHSIDAYGHSAPNVDKLIESSKKIEDYINGETKNENI